jgi:hypothetical protein
MMTTTPMKWHEIARSADKKTRHVMGISGGKDSAALAVYVKDQYPDIHERMEYFFTDTGAELEEVYNLLDKLEEDLGKSIKRLNSGQDFEHWLKIHNNLLPSVQQRWCTKTMKIKPFEEFVGEDLCISYVGIRGDENRKGYVSTKTNIQAVFPFVEDNIVREDVFRILEESVGIPEYYKWRSRSGCYFCFFQRQDEWLGLKRNHPELYEKAKAIESNIHVKGFDWDKGERKVAQKGYTWSEAGTLDVIVNLAEKREKEGKKYKPKETRRWQDIVKDKDDDDPEDQSCIICSL